MAANGGRHGTRSDFIRGQVRQDVGAFGHDGDAGCGAVLGEGLGEAGFERADRGDEELVLQIPIEK